MINANTREAGMERELSQAAARGYLRQQEKEETRKGQKEETTTRRRMARERRGAGSSLVSMETQF